MSTHNLHKVFKTTNNRVIAVYVISIVSIILAIGISFGLHVFWRLREYPFIKKRHPALVFISSICFIIILAIDRPLSGFSRISTYTSIELQWIRWIINVIGIQVQIIISMVRVYITCSDIHWSKANATQLWVKHIDINSKCKKSFIVSKHNKYGTLYRIYWHIIILIVIVISIIIILSIIEPDYGFVCNMIFWFLFIISMCLLWFYTPRYLDHFKIRVEIRIVLLLQCSLAVISLIYFVLSINDNIQFKQWFIIQCFVVVLLSILAYTQLVWVLYRFNLAKKPEVIRDRESSVSVAGFTDEKTNNEQVCVLTLDIIDIIKEKVGFEEFMKHLSKEFSMENLLGVVEMTQYKQRYREIRSIKQEIKNGNDPLETLKNNKSSKMVKVMNRVINSLSVSAENVSEDNIVSTDNISNNVSNDDETQKLKRSITRINVTEQCVELPPKYIPRSTIVYGSDFDNENEIKNIEKIKKLNLKQEAKRIINEIFEKYIFVGSEMELNLSHRLRRRCLSKLSYIDDMTDRELEHMFDKCIAALLRLMQDSYLRFKETKAFIRYEEKVKKRIRNDSLVRSENLGGIFGDLL